ncbi:MAG: zinc ribbon domain-containing protein [Rhodothermales bacterium]
MAERNKECPSCALAVDATAEVCPYCRYEFPAQRSTLKYAAWLMALLLLWPLFELLMLLFD